MLIGTISLGKHTTKVGIYIIHMVYICIGIIVKKEQRNFKVFNKV